jgi:hypothetical protein
VRDLDGVTRIPESYEVDALYDSPGGDVEAGNDALGKAQA